MTGLWLLLVPLAPLALLPLAALGDPARGRGGWLLPLAPLPAIVAACAFPAGTRLDLQWLLLGGSLGLDGVGRTFLLFTALLWLLAGFYARGYLAEDPKRRLFHSFFLATMAGNFGLLVAGDIPLFYLCFAVMSFCSYPLVVHSATPEARRAGRLYLLLVVAGELFLFSGLLLGYGTVEDLQISALAAGIADSPWRDVVFLLLLLGFGIKAGAVPLHLWLPLAHPVAPTPASAVLSGAMIKAGLFGLIRFLPLGIASLPGPGELLVVVGTVSAFYGVLLGTVQDEPKTVLAYSSISQMGFLLIALGLGLAAPGHWPAVAGTLSLYALHHALAKGALFLGVGITPPGGWRGGHPVMPLILLWPALALAGAPLTSGALVKSALKGHLSLAPHWFAQTGEWVLSAAAVGTTILMVRFFFVLSRAKGGGHGARRTMLAAWGGAVAGVLVLPWIMADPEQVWTVLTPAAAGKGFWPVALGLLLGWAGWTGRIPKGMRCLKAPPGDLVVLAERGARALRSRWAEGGRASVRTPLPPSSRETGRLLLEQGERRLRAWSVAGTWFLLLLLLFLLMERG